MKNTEHARMCDCLECSKNGAYNGLINGRKNQYFGNSENTVGFFTGQRKIDFADSPAKTADYYINAQLRALKPVTVYTNTSLHNKTSLRTVPAGAMVGEVASWVKDANGNLWWQLKGGGFVEHKTGLFDPKIAEYSSIGKQDQIKEALKQPTLNVGGLDKFNTILGTLSKHLISIVIFLLIGFMLVKR